MKQFLFLLFAYIVLSGEPNLPEHTLEVYGNASLGYYYVKIFVGKPEQQQTVIIDTGSGQLALPCNRCKHCSQKHINPPFDMRKSKTAEYVTCESSDPQCKRCRQRVPTQSCTFSISYAQGSSLEGIIIRDSIQFQSFSEGEEIVASFGCTTTQTNLFLKQQANGIFGLAPERTSNLLEVLYKKHHEFSGQQLQFSLCLAGNGGEMTVGGINEQLSLNSQPVKLTYSTYRNLYSLNDVKQISIGSAVIHEQNEKFGYYGIFIDSGSTFTYFPRKNFDIFKGDLVKQCQKHQKQCEIAEGQSTACFHFLGDTDIKTTINLIFNPVTIHLPNNQSLTWSPQKYFLLRDKSNREVCLGVQALDRFLLGANWMVDRNIVFNLKNHSILIYNDVECDRKETARRYMSQYTEKIDGHKPLSYKSSRLFAWDVGGVLKWVFGIILVFLGALGLILVIMKRRQNKKQKSHKPISSIQTEQSIHQMSST